MQKSSALKNLENDFLRLRFNTLRVGVGALLHAKGMSCEIIKPHAKFSVPRIFESDSLRRPVNTLGIGMSTLWNAIGNYFGILKSHAQLFASAKFWKRFSTALIQYLRDRDGRLMVCDRSLFRNSKIACKTFRFRKFLKTIFHDAHSIP